MDTNEVINLANDTTDRVTAAIREIGVEAMGVAGIAEVRKNTLDELAQALGHLETLRYVARGYEDKAAEHIVTPDAQAKTAGSNARHGVAGDFAPPQRKDRRNTETVENKPDAPSEGAERAEPAPPFKSFKTLEEMTEFVAGIIPGVNQRAHDVACKKGLEDAKAFHERQELKRSLLAPGEIYCDMEFLEQAHEAVCEILERVPDIEGDLAGEVNEAATRAFSRLTMVLRWGEAAQKEEAVDIDTSDNDTAETAGKAKKGSTYVQHSAGHEGAAE